MTWDGGLSRATRSHVVVVFTAGAYGDGNYGLVRKEFALFRQMVAAV
jgi:hypothetical protein